MSSISSVVGLLQRGRDLVIADSHARRLPEHHLLPPLQRGRDLVLSDIIVDNVLQRGRDLVIADSETIVDITPWDPRLQRGRDLVIADSRMANDNLLTMGFLLQRGRDLVIADRGSFPRWPTISI